MSLLVVETGPQLLVQDQGRRGSAHLGVPTSGALDQSALALGNRLVGNPEDAAGLEVLLGGMRLVCEGSGRVALTGAMMLLTVDGRPQPWGEAVPVRAGQTIEVGTAAAALRSWLAVAGGVCVDPVLGSRSTDTLTGLGPPTGAAGDRLPVGPLPAPGVAAAAVPSGSSPEARAWLSLALGPRDDWFTAAAVERLLTAEYVVTPSSNRVAVRLDGGSEGRLDRRLDDELPSEGLVTGAVQIPGRGQPLIFLADHPVTGGYPVLGVIDRQALMACAQLRPGDRLGFRLSPPSSLPRHRP